MWSKLPFIYKNRKEDQKVHQRLKTASSRLKSATGAYVLTSDVFPLQHRAWIPIRSNGFPFVRKKTTRSSHSDTDISKGWHCRLFSNIYMCIRDWIERVVTAQKDGRSAREVWRGARLMSAFKRFEIPFHYWVTITQDSSRRIDVVNTFIHDIVAVTPKQNCGRIRTSKFRNLKLNPHTREMCKI